MNVNMIAPYQGLLEWVGQPASGMSQQTGNAWKNVPFTLKYLDHQMQEQFITFNLSGPERVDQFLTIPLGTEIRVAWKPATRKYVDPQGQVKWFPSYEAFTVKVIPPEEQTRQLPQQQAQPAPAAPQYPQYQQQAQPYAPQYPMQYQPTTAPAYPAAPAPQPPVTVAQPQPAAAPAPAAPYQDLPF